MTAPRFVQRLALAVAFAFVAAVVAAIVLAIADLGGTGAGPSPVATPLLDIPAVGVHLSRGDAVVLFVAIVAAGIGWAMAAKADIRGG